MIPQKLMLQGSPNLTCKFSTMRRGNPLIFGVKCKVTSHKRPVPAMGICTLVSAGFFYLLLWLIWPCYNFDSIIKVKNCSKFNPKFQFFFGRKFGHWEAHCILPPSVIGYCCWCCCRT